MEAEQLEIFMGEVGKTFTQSYTTHKDKFKMNHRLKHKS